VGDGQPPVDLNLLLGNRQRLAVAAKSGLRLPAFTPRCGYRVRPVLIRAETKVHALVGPAEGELHQAVAAAWSRPFR